MALLGLADGQVAYNGLVVGPNTPYGVTAMENFEGFAARTNGRPVPRGHGNVPGKNYAAARDPLLKVLATGTPTTSIESAIRTLYDAWDISVDVELPLNFKRPTRPERIIYCRPTQMLRKLDPTSEFLTEQPVAWEASDPRIYSAAQHSVLLPLYTTAGGGIDFPIDYPFDYPAGSAATATANNAGNADAYPLYRFFAPAAGTCTSVIVHNLTTGEVLTIVTTIASGSVLSFNGTAYVTGNGGQVVGVDGSSRYGSWSQPRVPLRLAPGDNVLRFEITGTATAMNATATWSDTSLS